MKVFVENEAGSRIKNIHDEKDAGVQASCGGLASLSFSVWLRDRHTTAADGGNLDCFGFTARRLRTGDIVDCLPMGLMEQIEDGQEDHNVLASPAGEEFQFDDEARKALTDFVDHVFDHIAGKQGRAGRFLDREAAAAWTTAHQDCPPPQ